MSILDFLDLKGTKPGLTSVAVVNLNHCREYTIEQEPKDEAVEQLYPIDITKVCIFLNDEFPDNELRFSW